MSPRKIQSALISVYHKEGLAPLAQMLHSQGVVIYSTGGTETFLQNLDIPVVPVETLTDYPSILGGRVKTLHPKVFGGILFRRENALDVTQTEQYQIPSIDLVIVDLYPFEETVALKASEEEVVEKIDIGGISLIRAAAKNFTDVVVVSSRGQYGTLAEILKEKNGQTDLADRKRFAAEAFDITSQYDTAIFNYFNHDNAVPSLKISVRQSQPLRYGENPHQRGWFHGDLPAMFDQLHGKELSYNNLLDIDAAVLLMEEFKGETAFAILKHNNACGVALDPDARQAYLKALAADPVSAFGGVIITNAELDLPTAEELNKLFFEVLIAPSFSQEAFALLATKKNRILLKKKPVDLPATQVRTVLNGIMRQDRDATTETLADLRTVTQKAPTDEEKAELVFAAKICKHTKSNTIVLTNHKQLISSGVGQTSRVDSLKQAIEKARAFGFDLHGAVMASDAFFPFPDCVEIAHAAGIAAVIQPGGSIRDQDSVDFCDNNNMAMVMTGIRHFKH